MGLWPLLLLRPETVAALAMPPTLAIALAFNKGWTVYLFLGDMYGRIYLAFHNVQR